MRFLRKVIRFFFALQGKLHVLSALMNRNRLAEPTLVRIGIVIVCELKKLVNRNRSSISQTGSIRKFSTNT